MHLPFDFHLADFVIQEENDEAIKEVLAILRKWNPTWKPRFFITDYSLAEMNAIESGIIYY